MTKKPPLVIFAENLNFLLEKRKIEKKDIAKILQMPEKSIDPWFEARCYPRIQTLVKLAKILKYRDISDLVSKDIRKKKLPDETLPEVAKLKIKETVDYLADLLQE